MSILLTGINGFIGRNIETALLLEDIEVFGVDEDIFTIDDWRQDLERFVLDTGVDEVLHVGACSDTLETDVNYMMTRNYEFTVVLSDICKKHGIPLVYSSSAANTGVDGLQPSNLYGWSKKAAEDYVIKNNQIALRYYNVYGPGEENKGKMASVAFQAYKKFIEDKKVYLFPGKPSRDFVYIQDVVSANIFALRNYHILGKRFYHVGSGESRHFEDMMELLNIPYEYTSEDVIPNGYQFYTSSSRKMMMPGWNPEYNLERGLGTYLKHLQTFFTKNEKM